MILGLVDCKMAAEATESFKLSTGRIYVLKRISARDNEAMEKRLNELGKGFGPAVGCGLYKCFVKSIEPDGTENLADPTETEADIMDAINEYDQAEIGELFFIFMQLRGLSTAQEKAMAQGFRQMTENSTP